ncbi:hypothetical protein KBC03_08325 [Patescibacteria group bacterium]|nr:hypothetical protein [Patescibacteria group bacterium]
MRQSNLYYDVITMSTMPLLTVAANTPDENINFHDIAVEVLRQIKLDDEVIKINLNLGLKTPQAMLGQSIFAQRLTQNLSSRTQDHEKIKDEMKKVIQEKIDSSINSAQELQNIQTTKDNLFKNFSTHRDNNLSLLMAINQCAPMSIDETVTEIQSAFSIQESEKEHLKQLIIYLRAYNEIEQSKKNIEDEPVQIQKKTA